MTNDSLDLNLTVTPSQLRELLIKGLGAGYNIMVTGIPGVGKTAIGKDVVLKDLKYNMLLSHPITEDPTYQSGLGFAAPDRTHAQFLPFGTMYEAIKTKKDTVWIVDDFGQADDSVKASYMQIFHGKRVNNHVISDKIRFLVLTNRREDKAHVRGMLEPVKSRFHTIVELITDYRDWLIWGADNKIHEAVLGWISWQPNSLCKFAPTLDFTNTPIPRTWEHLSDLIKLNLSPSVELAAYAGAIGMQEAIPFYGFLRMYRNMINPDVVLADPTKFKMPACQEAPAVLYALSRALSMRATRKTIGNIVTIADMMPAEYAELLLRTIVDNDKDLLETKPMVNYKIKHAANQL